MSFIRGARLTIMRSWADLEVGIMSILRMPGIIVWKSRRESPYVKHGCRWGEPRVQHRGGGGWCRKNACVQHGGGQGKSFRGISHQGGFLTLTGFQEMVGSFPWQDLVYHKLYGKEPGVGRTIHLSHSYEREAELALLTPLEICVL